MQQEELGEDPAQGKRGRSTWGETESWNWEERLMERGRERARILLGSSNTGCKRPLEKSRLAETLTQRPERVQM